MSQESVKAAIEKVWSKNLGYGEAALKDGIPQTTLERYAKQTKKFNEVKKLASDFSETFKVGFLQ